MNTDTVYIHPGFGKSGTTTIQQNIFDQHQQILSIGRSDPHNKIRKEICKIEGVNYNPSALTRIFNNELTQFDADQHRCTVWSDETLVSNAYMRNEIAQRLKQSFENAHIIFTIRNQMTALASFYGNHGRILKGVPKPFSGQHVSLPSYLAHAFENQETSYVGLIDYNATIELYERIFGQDRVHVFLFEEFVKNKPTFIQQLSKTLQIDSAQTSMLLGQPAQNGRDSNRGVAYSKLRQKLLPGVSIKNLIPFGNHVQQWFSAYLSKGKGVKIDIPDNWQTQLTELYKEGNAQLMKRKSLPLDKYEYPL